MQGIGIKIRESKGDSPDELANRLWHRDLIELSAAQVLDLARAIQTSTELDRFSEKQVFRLLARSLAEGRIGIAKLRLGQEYVRKLTWPTTP